MEGILLAKEVCLAPALHLLRERALRDRWGSWERRGKTGRERDDAGYLLVSWYL